MHRQLKKFDPGLSVLEWQRLLRLGRFRLARVDASLVAQASHQWRKVARVVGMAAMDESGKIAGAPDQIYAWRVNMLVRRGVLQSQGKISEMRYSEVRLVKHGGNEALGAL